MQRVGNQRHFEADRPARWARDDARDDRDPVGDRARPGMGDAGDHGNWGASW